MFESLPMQKKLDCNCTVPLFMHLYSRKAPYENGDCELNSGVVDGSITFYFVIECGKIETGKIHQLPLQFPFKKSIHISS